MTCHGTGTLELPQSLRDTVDFAYIAAPPDFFHSTALPPSTKPYHLRLKDLQVALGAVRCHRKGWRGEGIKVAMPDTGFAEHPYFNQHDYDVRRVATTSDLDPYVDKSGHGTGESANLLAVAPDCTLFGVKLEEFTAEALEVARAQGEDVKIISCSWGYPVDNCSKDELRRRSPEDFKRLRHLEWEINDAVADGVLVIFSAGNDGDRSFPSCMPNVLSAGGVTVYQDLQCVASEYASSFTSQLFPDRAVPDVCGIVGENSKNGHIMLPVPEGSPWEGKNLPRKHRHCGWGLFSGTSAAAPQIAGLAALMLSANQGLTAEDLKQILKSTADDVKQGQSASGDQATDGRDLATGAGLINAWEACNVALEWSAGSTDAPIG